VGVHDFLRLNEMDAAESSARKTQRLDGQHRFPQVHLILADIFQSKHDIAGTVEQLQSYLKFAPEASNAEKIRSRLQELESSSKNLADKQPEHP
jgi:hypothetical protein